MRLATSEDCNEVENAGDVVIHFYRLTGRRVNFGTEAGYVKRIVNYHSPDPDVKMEAYKTFAKGLEVLSELTELKSVRVFKSIEAVENFLSLREKFHRQKRHPSNRVYRSPTEYLQKEVLEQIKILQSKSLDPKNSVAISEFKNLLEL